MPMGAGAISAWSVGVVGVRRSINGLVPVEYLIQHMDLDADDIISLVAIACNSKHPSNMDGFMKTTVAKCKLAAAKAQKEQ